jgi:CRISPR system Cascade subunit CasA
MDLLSDPWIPVRGNRGTGAFRLLTLEALLCGEGDWRVSLPRDDLELACIQLLVCMAQVMFIPRDDRELRMRVTSPLSPEAFADGTRPCRDWFDLDHATQPFMQSRGVVAADDTPIQKLLVGLPEGNNHAFFNEAGEVRRIGGSAAAVALFNQASNTPSFGGGFKGSLRGGAPITTLLAADDLREMIWRNVATLPRIRTRFPDYEPDFQKDRPVWVEPIPERETISAHSIGLARGLFWQPARVELVPDRDHAPCDLIGIAAGTTYGAFRKAKFNFTVDGLWHHPHGAMTAAVKKGAVEWKHASFTTTAPAWTHLSELVVPRSLDGDAKEGATPALPVVQAPDVFYGESVHLLVGGYRANQASIIERRHELFTLGQGWEDDRGRLERLVKIGTDAKSALRGKLYFVVQGHRDKGLKGVGAPIHDTGERLFYARTEGLIHETLREAATFRERKRARVEFAQRLGGIALGIFEELTDPYARKPELIPIIAWARRTLGSDLNKLTEVTP